MTIELFVTMERLERAALVQVVQAVQPVQTVAHLEASPVFAGWNGLNDWNWFNHIEKARH